MNKCKGCAYHGKQPNGIPCAVYRKMPKKECFTTLEEAIWREKQIDEYMKRYSVIGRSKRKRIV